MVWQLPPVHFLPVPRFLQGLGGLARELPEERVVLLPLLARVKEPLDHGFLLCRQDHILI